MVGTIVSKAHASRKSAEYQTAHESLRALLQQARSIANSAICGDPTQNDWFHLTWCLLDLLTVACEQCETLRPSDIV